MTATVSVVIPWRDRGIGLERAESLRWIKDTLLERFPSWQLVESSDGRSAGEPWSASTARNRGVAASSGDVLVLLDADTWVEERLLADAVRRVSTFVAMDAETRSYVLGPPPRPVAASWPWVQPHTQILRLSEGQSIWYWDGARIAYDEAGEVHKGYLRELESAPYRQFPGGVPCVITRELYEACPQDPRFNGWGAEDNAWGYALSTLHVPMYRLKGNAVHFFHTPDPVRAQRQRGVPRDKLKGADWGHHELFMRYHQANGDREAMRALVAEHTGANAQ